ncbi:hypothetical protein FHG64_08240 [Antarcticibacterium flavum]|uniref:Uncharacterized protein n=1 Tax=Antarcticibacterium flavum TaxID=2058175 RepID=A0A5B7X441_9FLAO|nr:MULTISPECIES: hypothetical protein [Antarcticibacterium]MCM4161115.1 hypothetical protein [Antarcticibacterium sp. W02-3]QCY69383.1 hypothetical protein FHG64_08240 [Antarcticibacterium flavum]
MKIDFIVISGILVIFSFLPFILFPLLRSKDEKNLRNKFKNETSSRGLNISYMLAWNSNLAGIDILRREFVLTQWLNEKFVVKHVDLNKIHTLKIMVENRLVERHNKNTEELSRISLAFFQSNSVEPVMVNLFDYDLNFTQDYEYKNAQKLLAELQKYACAQPVLKHTA